MVDIIPVQSSNISGYSYDEHTEDLIVFFTNGSQYMYYLVPPNVIEEVFKGSGSVGSAFHQLIKNGGFQFVRQI